MMVLKVATTTLRSFRFSICSVLNFARASHSSVFLCRIPDKNSNDVLQGAYSDVRLILNEIKNVLNPFAEDLKDVVHYPFSNKGKLLRPLLVTLVSACANSHVADSVKFDTQVQADEKLVQQRALMNLVSPSQNRIATIAEMIHTASLVHDDLLDSACLRRGKEASHRHFGDREAIFGGDFILLQSSRLLAQIGNTKVIAVLSQVIADLINGEMMQLNMNTEDDDQRFQIYLMKTYRKTASLIANSCKAVAMLTVPSLPADLIESIYEFGRHLGMAFQLVDDVLDFVAEEKNLGKPGQGADLQLGIATGPVLFAAQRYPELNSILLRQFSLDGDKERAFELVYQSDGIGQTRMLAEFHFQAAQRCLTLLRDSAARKALLHVAATCLQRDR